MGDVLSKPRRCVLCLLCRDHCDAPVRILLHEIYPMDVKRRWVTCFPCGREKWPLKALTPNDENIWDVASILCEVLDEDTPDFPIYARSLVTDIDINHKFSPARARMGVLMTECENMLMDWITMMVSEYDLMEVCRRRFAKSDTYLECTTIVFAIASMVCQKFCPKNKFCVIELLFTPKVWSVSRLKFRGDDHGGFLYDLIRDYFKVMRFVRHPVESANILRHLVRGSLNGNDQLLTQGSEVILRYGAKISLRINDSVWDKRKRLEFRRRLFFVRNCAIQTND